MSKNSYSTNIVLVELTHLVVGIGFGIIPWGWIAGVLFVLYKELYKDPHDCYSSWGVTWLWQVPYAYLTDSGYVVKPEYRWGQGPRSVIGFVKKALCLDIPFYAAGIMAGLIWGPW